MIKKQSKMDARTDFGEKHTIARLLASIFFLFPQKRKKVDAVVCFRTGEGETPKKNISCSRSGSCGAYLLAQ